MAQEVIYNPGQPINITGVDNNIVFESVRNIIATSFASYLFEDNTNSTVNGAQVVVTLTHVMTDGVEYNASNLQNQSAEGAQLSYLINNKRQAGYTIYDFDVKSGLGERAAEVQAQAIATVSQSITRSLLCEYASLIVSSCLNGATTDVHPNVIVIDNFTDLLNIDEAGAKKNVNILKNTFAGLKQLYNKYELGTAIEDYLLVIGTRGQQALNNALMFSASDKAYEEIGKEGGWELRINNGMVYAIEDLIVELSLSAGQSFNAIKYDFSNVYGYIIHKQAVSFKYNLWNSNPVPQKDGSVYYPIQYVFGGLVVLPELVKIIANSSILPASK